MTAKKMLKKFLSPRLYKKKIPFEWDLFFLT